MSYEYWVDRNIYLYLKEHVILAVHTNMIRFGVKSVHPHNIAKGSYYEYPLLKQFVYFAFSVTSVDSKYISDMYTGHIL